MVPKILKKLIFGTIITNLKISIIVPKQLKNSFFGTKIDNRNRKHY